ncbi:MAG: heme-binding protein [Pseudomonadota bacterium]
MINTFALGEAEASLAIAAIRSELQRRGKVAVIAVGDTHGELIALLKMDGASLPSILIACNKVYTSARNRGESGGIGRASMKEGWDLANFGDKRYIGWEGGAAVHYQGQVLGAVAVSGLSGEEDIELAQIGISAILKSLEGAA